MNDNGKLGATTREARQDRGWRLAFSHVGFFVADMDRVVDFYHRVLGFFITDRGVLNGKPITFLSRDPNEHHQIVLVAGRDPGALQNINQISFRVQSLGELQALYRRLVATGVAGMDPVTHGNAWSLYFQDPEGNRLEVFADTDWYIAQPLKEPLDLDLPEAEIRRQTLAFCRDRPGFKSIAQWREQMRALMAEEPASADPRRIP
ncbi:MAG: VOC family protein [Porticoccaceae bacterium]|jgi:catechol 2,3-dioxygenase-like lactoylglutathione lyase family enzyme|nr:VOC family protein [Porticoccaceae bacterium]MEA3301484.1 VOC family protein [Pseudomonadota bacterium]HLS98331.1 VOC family protein [Porticoccaceae bacterium]